MTRSTARCIAGLAAAAGALTSSGCSPGRPGPGADTAPSPTVHSNPSRPSPTPAAPPARPSTRDGASPASPGAPRPGSMDEPATSSGALSRASFPRPRQLGRGWRYAVDRGSAEEGYAGNGTPSLARDPQEVAQAAVPFGCSRRSPLPVPLHALEVDYTLHGAKVVAVRGSFADPGLARDFFTRRTADLVGCSGRTSSPAIGPLVGSVSEPAPDAVASDRTPRSDPWREVALLDGASVVLVAAQGQDPLDTEQTRRLVRLFRARPASS